MKRRLACTILGQNVDGEEENTTYALGVPLLCFPQGKTLRYLFVVHANSTKFSSSNLFATIMHTKLRYNITKMFFLPYKRHCILYEVLMHRSTCNADHSV